MPAGHGHKKSLAQVHVRSPAAFGSWQTQKPDLWARRRIDEVPPSTPPRLLHSTQ